VDDEVEKKLVEGGEVEVWKCVEECGEKEIFVGKCGFLENRKSFNLERKERK